MVKDGYRRVGGWLAAELTIVVLGVLIALQVEAWRGGKEAERLETAQLIALHADLRENRVRVDTIRVLQEKVVEAGKTMLSLHGQSAGQVAPDSVANLIAWALRWEGYEPLSSAYDVMVNSGDITRVNDEMLLRELAKFFGEVRAGFEDHEESMALLLDLRRRLADHGLALLSTNLRDALELPGSPTQAAAANVIQDPHFMNLLAYRTRLEMNRVARYQRFRNTIEGAIGLIGAELDARGVAYRQPQDL